MTDIQLTGFEMQHKLGEGGMAAVWKARQVSLDRTVAIKILSAHFASDPADIQRFQQEAQSAAKLKHPGIVQVYDANIESGLYFFVMEFVDGYTCADWLKRKGTLSEQDVLLIADCVADALGYAWEKEKMIHCDIKPDNIMIDEDGTVKVTDLGLSRTISGMHVDEESDEILGTPAYMAPEQAMGEANQDCRLDMYALGAMMYHLSTGKLLFEGAGESEVMERQITDTVENPRDLNPSLTRGFCTLVRALMAKDKEHRPTDWSHVREAIARVKKGLGPRLKLPPDATSTVLESAKAADEPVRPHVTAGQIGSTLHAPRKKGAPVGLIVGAVVLVVLIALAAKFLIVPNRPGGGHPGQAGGGPQGGGAASGPTAETRARSMYYSASGWEKANRASYDEAIRRYREVVDNCGGTKYAERAAKDIARLESAKSADALAGVMQSLDAQARPLIAQNEYDRAIAVYQGYSGQAAAETARHRSDKVAELKQRKEAWVKAEEARRAAELEARFSNMMRETVGLIAKADYKKASAYLEDVLIQGSLPSRNDEIHQIRGILESAANIETKILDSFQRQAQQTVSVQLAGGPKDLRIQGVQNGVVLANEEFRVGGALASRAHNFRLSDLSVAERLSRMGNDSEPEVALVKGVLAYQSRAFSHARRYFQMTHHLLEPGLLDLLDGSRKEAEASARDDLAAIVNELGIDLGASFDGASAAARVSAARVDELELANAKAKAAAYAAKYSSAGFYADYKPVVDAIQGLTPSADPVEVVVDRPVAVVDLQPEDMEGARNVDAFVDALLSTNPDLDSEDIRCRKGDDGVVTSVRIFSSALRDISPVSALKGLRSLEVRVRGDRQAPLVDLGPLRGLPLESLELGPTKVGSLEPLEGMPLRELSIRGSLVRDLKPIKDCPLVSLDVSYTKVFDFSPISQLDLERLDASGTQVRSLAFLRNMKLKELALNETGVFDFSPLARTPLEVLRASGTQLRSLTFLRDCPLRILEANSSSVSDLSPLEACAISLKQLHVRETPVRSFTTLRRLNLTHLAVGHTDFADLALIRHMTLAYLDVAGTRLQALDGLGSNEMRYLNIADTSISSIAFLQGAPIEELVCNGSRVRNFRPIYGSSIERLVLDDPGSKWALYGELPALERVNGQYIKHDPEF